MEFRKILYFLKVAENCSFRKAARELYISPQSLSRQIRELEEVLGYPLFFRNTARVELTDKGRAVYGRFAGLRDEWENAWRDSVEDQNVKFAFFPGIPKNGVLEQLIHTITKQHQDWNVELFAMDTPEIKTGIESGQLDLALTVFHKGENYDGYRMIPIVKKDAYVCMPADHPLADKPEISLEELYKTKVLFARRVPVNDGSIFHKIQQNGQVAYINENLSLMQAIQAHKGVSLLPEEDTEGNRDIIYRPLAEDCRFYFAICLFFKKQHWLASQFENLWNDSSLSTMG